MPKEEKVVNDFAEEKAFIKENSTEFAGGEHPVLQMTQEPYFKFMAGKGITKATLETIRDAHHGLYNGAIAVASDLLCDTKGAKVAESRLRMPGTRYDAIVTREKTVTNPKDGSKDLKFGAVTARVRVKSQLDKGLLAQCAADVAKASK